MEKPKYTKEKVEAIKKQLNNVLQWGNGTQLVIETLMGQIQEGEAYLKN